MAHLDLDAARAARREAAGESVTFTFGGEQFDLPPEMPLDALEVVAGLPDEDDEIAMAGMMIPLLRAMLGPDEWARFAAHRPSLEDVTTLAEHVWGSYAVDPPTPSRSERRARGTGTQSKRTSSRTTGSTSGTRSTANVG